MAIFFCPTSLRFLKIILALQKTAQGVSVQVKLKENTTHALPQNTHTEQIGPASPPPWPGSTRETQPGEFPRFALAQDWNVQNSEQHQQWPREEMNHRIFPGCGHQTPSASALGDPERPETCLQVSVCGSGS